MSFLGWPAEVNQALEAITLHYINQKIYYPVSCQPKLVEDIVFVRCTAVGAVKVTGGIYVITNARGKLEIIALNGRAQSHVRGIKIVTDPEARSIAVSDSPRPYLTQLSAKGILTKAIEAFGL